MKTCSIDGCTMAYRARGLCGSHYNQAHQPNRHARQATHCVVCNAAIARAYRADRRPTCSPQCRHELAGQRYGQVYDYATHAMARAKRLGATIVDYITNTEVFERDDWTCYMCGITVDANADCYQPNSATIDHVTPLALGGQHTLANVKCACFQCNSTKQAKVLSA